MKMPFTVTYQDGRSLTAVAMPKDFVNFERQYGRSISKFDSEAPMEWLFYLAWAPLHRLRQETGTFDEFLDLVDDVVPLDDEETPAAAADPSPLEVSPVE